MQNKLAKHDKLKPVEDSDPPDSSLNESLFSVKKPESPQFDFNSILDEVAPTSTGGIENATGPADALGIEFTEFTL